jgi:hypothetical protein
METNRMKWGQGVGRKILIVALLVIFSGFVPAGANPPRLVPMARVLVLVKHRHHRHRLWLRRRRHRRLFIRVLLLRHRHHRLRPK